jgi:hypothetical protein
VLVNGGRGVWQGEEKEDPIEKGSERKDERTMQCNKIELGEFR